MVADRLDFVVFDFMLQLGRPLGDVWQDGGSLPVLLGFFGTLPYVATARFLQYIDSRTRRDGWDIQLAFLALAAQHEGPGTADSSPQAPSLQGPPQEVT